MTQNTQSPHQKRVAYKVPLLWLSRLCFVICPEFPLQKFRGEAVERKFSKPYCNVR